VCGHLRTKTTHDHWRHHRELTDCSTTSTTVTTSRVIRLVLTGISNRVSSDIAKYEEKHHASRNMILKSQNKCYKLQIIILL